MKNQSLAIKIKDLRAKKGFSQEQLSEEATLSLRTIQRIEKGETVPRGNTLLKLTAALGVTPDDLLEWTVIEDKSYLRLMTFTALAVVFHPILGIILPLGMWILKREKVQKVASTGKKLLNFQISWTAILYPVYFINAGGAFFPFNYNFLHSFPVLLVDLSIFTITILGLYVYNFFFIIYNLVSIRTGKSSKYFPAIPFIK